MRVEKNYFFFGIHIEKNVFANKGILHVENLSTPKDFNLQQNKAIEQKRKRIIPWITKRRREGKNLRTKESQKMKKES